MFGALSKLRTRWTDAVEINLAPEKAEHERTTSLTRCATIESTKHIKFQVIWQSTDILGRAKVTICTVLCLTKDDMEKDIARMLNPDELVTGPLRIGTVAYLNITFPLSRPAKRLIRPADPTIGFTRAELCRCVAEEYWKIYEAERISSCDSSIWDENQHGPGDGTGKYGIHTHGLRDLLLSGVLWHPSRDEFDLVIDV